MDWLREQSQNIKEAHEIARDPTHANKYFRAIDKKQDNRHPLTFPHNYSLGEYVLVQRKGPKPKLALLSPWMGPAMIVGVKPSSLIVKYLKVV